MDFTSICMHQPVAAGCQEAMLVDRTRELIREANKGKWPVNLWQWKRVARYYGIKIQFCSPSVIPSPESRGHFIRLPRTHRLGHLEEWMAHEVGEAILWHESQPPCITECTAHEIACIVQNTAQG